MVEHSDYLIAYAWHPASNARDLVEYAKKCEKRGLIQVTELQGPSVDISDTYMGAIERGERSLTLDTLVRLVNRLGVFVIT